MTGRKRLLSFVLAALFVAAGGSARGDRAGRSFGSPSPCPGPRPGSWLTGTTPSGGDYTLSGIDPLEFGDSYFREASLGRVVLYRARDVVRYRNAGGVVRCQMRTGDSTASR